MPVLLKEGCLIEAMDRGEVQAIAHQANCQNTMGSGVAKAIRARWPEVYEADCQTTKGDYDKLGSLSWTPVITKAGHGPVFNLYGQFFYGREEGVVYTDLDALRNACNTMRIFVDELEITKIGVPMLGCGLGGAKWDDVEAILVGAFDGLDVTVYCK